MCGNGWGLQPWGSTPWGIDVGWGSGQWGVIPWGGCPGPEPPTGPTEPDIRPGWRYERVRRYREQLHERELVRNVIFAVEGLHAKARHGKPRVYAGTGVTLRLRRLPPAHFTLGVAKAGAASLANSQIHESANAQCGEVEVFASCIVTLGETPSSTATVGTSNVRTMRNPTDEEILMMIAELV